MRRIAAVGAASLCALIAVPAAAQSPTPALGGAPGVTATSAVLVDLSEGGQVLFARRVRAVRPVASLTKVVTALVVRDEYTLDEVVTVDNRILTANGSSLGLRAGMRYTVRDLLYALMLKSGNDVAVALASHHPLGYDYFIGLMNTKARALGAYDSSFKNPHGLDAPGHVSTAWDIAIFARQLLADPVLSQVVKTHRYAMRWEDGTRRSFSNHNKLLARYPGTIGVKTGFTEQAGHSLIAAAETPANTLLSVVLGSQDHYADTTSMFEYGKNLILSTGSGGGGPDRKLLPVPPEAPSIPGLGRGGAIESAFDPRDSSWWTWMVVVLAFAAAASAVIRRPAHPLARAAEFHAWLEPVVPPQAHRRSRRR